jgi:hypothetical protein
MPGLTPPRHTPTLPKPVELIRFLTLATTLTLAAWL